jgi:hypothetical protein
LLYPYTTRDLEQFLGCSRDTLKEKKWERVLQGVGEVGRNTLTGFGIEKNECELQTVSCVKRKLNSKNVKNECLY